jgi:hypothetical protein
LFVWTEINYQYRITACAGPQSFVMKMFVSFFTHLYVVIPFIACTLHKYAGCRSKKPKKGGGVEGGDRGRTASILTSHHSHLLQSNISFYAIHQSFRAIYLYNTISALFSDEFKPFIDAYRIFPCSIIYNSFFNHKYDFTFRQ